MTTLLSSVPRDEGVAGGVNAKVLIVDDDVAFLRTTRMTLSGAGFGDVMTAVDESTALQIVSMWGPALVLVDIDLGAHAPSGLDLIRAIGPRSDGPLPVVLSGNRSQEQFFRAARSGAVDFLVKGPALDLAFEVRRLLEGERGVIPGRTLPEIVSNLGYLRSFGLTKNEIALLTDFASDFPNLGELAERREQSSVQLRKAFCKIYDRLGFSNLHQLIRALTICELFRQES